MISRPSNATHDAASPGFWFYALHLWTVFGLFLSNLFFVLTLLATGVGGSWRSAPWGRWRSILLPAGILAACTFASTLLSHDLWTSAGPGIRELLNLATLPLGLLLVRGERASRRVVNGILILAGAVAAHGLVQLLFLGYGGIDKRIPGPFSHYMTFAGFLLVADLLLIAQLVAGHHRSAWRWLVLGLVNLALIASLTRSAWVALIVVLTLLLLLRAPRWVAAYVPAAVLLVVLAPVPVLQRIMSIPDLGDVSNYDRICMIETGLKMVQERPAFGLGPRMVRERYPIYRHPTAPRAWVPHLHDNLIQIAAENGIPATVAYLWMMLAGVWAAFQGFRAGRGRAESTADVHLGAMLALVGFNLAGLFEFNWGDTEIQRITLFLLALPYCVENGGD